MSFSFGTPTSAPATSNLSGGFSFGANKPATPSFGLTPSTQASTGLFGTPASSAPAFGTTSTPAFGAAAPTFGAASAAPTFGAASAAPTFGNTNTSIGLGAGLNFGTASTAATGTTPSAGLGGFNLSGTATSTAAPTTGLGGFGFGTATTSAPSTGLGFGFGSTTTTSASTGLTGFGFGTATTTQPGFGLLNTSTTAGSTGLFSGLGAKPGGGIGLGTSLPASTAAPGLGGLGSLSTSVSGVGTGTTTASDGKSEPPKQIQLPNEISTTVNNFKEFVKKQKSLSSDVTRVSIKPLHKVARDAEELIRAVLSLSGEVGKSRAQSKRLRTAGANALVAAEAAGRDPPGTILEGPAPPPFVKELISELEQQLITFRRQMDVADKQMQASPRLLTEQELTLGIRRMHESLVALAGRLQAVHTQVEAQKEQYLNLRKYVLKDPTDVFESHTSVSGLDQILKDAESNRKKSKMGNFSDFSDTKSNLANIQHLAGPSPFPYLVNALSPYPSAETSAPTWQPQAQPTLSNLNTSLNTSNLSTFGTNTSSFQLQKPPGKRGKQ